MNKTRAATAHISDIAYASSKFSPLNKSHINKGTETSLKTNAPRTLALELPENIYSDYSKKKCKYQFLHSIDQTKFLRNNSD